jgi:hypothetical protein
MTNLLNNLKPKDKAPKAQIYLAVEIGKETVKSATWQVVGGKPELLTPGSIEVVDIESETDLLQALDASIVKATENLDFDPTEAILSLPDDWVNEEGVIPEKKMVLKDISNKLDIKPLGFVVTLEAVTQYLKAKHGTPYTGILLELTRDEVAVNWIKNGTLYKNQTVGRSDDIVLDLQEAIARFGQVDNLPPNLLLFDGHTDLEEIKQSLLAGNLQDSLPFLHTPKIDTLGPTETIQAVIAAGGPEVVSALEATTNNSNLSPNDEPSESEPEPELEPESVIPEELTAEPPSLAEDEDSLPDKQDEFGFVSSDTPSDNLAAIKTEESFIPEAEMEDEVPEPEMDLDDQPEMMAPNRSRLRSTRRLPLPPVILILGIVLLMFIALLGAAVWLIPKADVTVFTYPQNFDQSIEFNLNPNASAPDPNNQAIPVHFNEVTVTANQSAPATGEKLIGDKARGKVVLYNRTTSPKVFPSGTKLKSGSLVYTIDQDITVASASTKENSDLSVTTEPATATVDITAANIGADYNLGKDTEFLVANFDKSSYLARVKDGITGGTSRQITAVSAKDISALQKSLRDMLTNDAQGKAGQQADPSLFAVLLNDTATFEEDFSAKVGEEAETINLSSSLTVKALTFKLSELYALLQAKAPDRLSPTLDLKPGQLILEVSKITKNPDSTYQIVATAHLKLTATYSQKQIKDKIVGRQPKVAGNYLKTLQNFAKAEIKIDPALPDQLKFLPLNPANITLSIKTKE